jgi:hypothetical protein
VPSGKAQQSSLLIHSERPQPVENTTYEKITQTAGKDGQMLQVVASFFLCSNLSHCISSHIFQ